MIVAIDETGDFNPLSSSKHFFVACHIRRGQKEKQFLDWEESVPAGGRLNGEVKGARLSLEHCESFVEMVVLSEPRVVITPVAIVPSDHSPAIIEQHRAVQVAYWNDLAIRYSMAGNKKARNHFHAIGDWLRALNHQQYLKIASLCWCVGISKSDVVGHAIVGEYDLELADLEYKIDRDFIKDRIQVWAWGRLLAVVTKALEGGDHEVTIADTWAPDHPFLKRFGRTNPAEVDFGPLFTRRVFRSSKDTWELRVADIAASIAQRALNEGEAERTFARLQLAFAGRGAVNLLQLGGFNPHRARTARPDG